MRDLADRIFARRMPEYAHSSRRLARSCRSWCLIVGRWLESSNTAIFNGLKWCTLPYRPSMQLVDRKINLQPLLQRKGTRKSIEECMDPSHFTALNFKAQEQSTKSCFSLRLCWLMESLFQDQQESTKMAAWLSLLPYFWQGVGPFSEPDCASNNNGQSHWLMGNLLK